MVNRTPSEHTLHTEPGIPFGPLIGEIVDTSSGLDARFANLGCGGTYVDSRDWLNLDFHSNTPAVIATNLSKPLPIPDNSLEVVYSSHFLEHVPLSEVPALLGEIYRVLKPGGVVRLVVPDFENIAREYLSQLDSGDEEKAFFCMVELLDQCIRKKSGGQLAGFLGYGPSADLIPADLLNYVRRRVDNGNPSARPLGKQALLKRIVTKIHGLIRKSYLRIVLKLLPSDFVRLNVSTAAVGELHQWMWDYCSLRRSLGESGFVDISRAKFDQTRIQGFPLEHLDIGANNVPRKGAESMFIEASK